LRTAAGIPTGEGLHREPEGISGAKERLSSLLGIPYSEVIDQPAMAMQFDMDVARGTCPSFDKCWRMVQSLLGH
jgi:hypothetical protein